MYDIKYLMKFCDNLHGGLNKLAEVLQVERIGPQHQVCWKVKAGRHCRFGILLSEQPAGKSVQNLVVVP